MHSSAPNSPPPFHGSPTSSLDLHILSSSGFSDNGCDSPTMAALQRFLPSNNEDSWTQEHLYACDEFRMFEFKVRRCMRGRSHDWTECPFAHPGEKARRRDPRRFHYSGTACPDFRKGCCKNGDSCDLAHGVFECWLHPARYRTQPCKDGRSCKRKVCFFAHTPQQLRLPPQQLPSPPMSPLSDTSPPLSPCATARDVALLRYMAEVAAAASAVPPRYMERMNSLPVNLNEADRRSRLMGQSHSFNGRSNVKGLVSALQRQLEINEAHGVGAGYPYGGYVSPPVSPYARSPLYRSCNAWNDSGMEYPEPEAFQTRVESGRDLRAKIYGKMIKENLPECGECPDLGWVNELVAIN